MRVMMVAIALLMCALVVASQQADSVAGNDGIVFTIEHRLDGENFVPRTKINLVKKADGKQALVFPEKNGIFGDDTAPLRKLLQENSLYTIRIQSHSGNTSSAPILASLPACELQKSGFKEDMTVYFDGKQKLIGVAYSTPASTVARECDHTKVKDAATFQTRIKLGDSVPIQWVPIKAVGARPAGMKDVKLGPEDATARPEKKTFLERYWYIVLFMVIYMFLGRGAEPAKEGAAGAPAPAAAPAAK